jgi:hypothetical protein
MGWKRVGLDPPSARCKLLIPLEGEMSEWFKEHAWKTIPASCIK